jgi:heterotetrameric sarcosine oxidase delta subunit
MGVQIPCPHCGPREFSEFSFGGEVRELESADPQRDFDRVYLRENAAALQVERWFHAYGCRRWFTIRRDTVDNRVLQDGNPT